MAKLILHLCADLGSDSHFYDLDPEYTVLRVGEDTGVENFTVNEGMEVHGIIANPPCTDFSVATGFDKKRNLEEAKGLVWHCQRIISEASPKWWVIENPATGRLKELLGKPSHSYEPWQFGTPWTKRTALWGNFNMPEVRYPDWESVPKNENLYIRPGRPKPSLAFLHKSAIQYCPEYSWCADRIKTDADFRSLCSMGFAKAFKEANP
jgi:hypothetical protein